MADLNGMETVMQEQEKMRNEEVNPIFVVSTAGIALLLVSVVSFAVLWGGLSDTVEGRSVVVSSEAEGNAPQSRENDTTPEPAATSVGEGASPFGKVGGDSDAGDDFDADDDFDAGGDDPEGETKRPGKSAPEDYSADDWKREIEREWSELLGRFEEEGITVDLEKKRVTVKGAIIRDKESRRYPIEYVVVSEGGNTHEALILVKTTPSNLNAALLSLGLEPGTTVIFRKKDPPPSPEDVESGKESAYEVIPPAGTVMHVYVHYEGWTEKPYRPLEDMILNLRTNETLSRVGWVYVGSRFAKVLLGRERVNQYMADLERNIAALYLTGYGNAIFDVNTLEGVDDSLFDVNPELAPPLGAPVTLIFSLDELDE
jgi:hypothetical protein